MLIDVCLICAIANRDITFGAPSAKIDVDVGVGEVFGEFPRIIGAGIIFFLGNGGIIQNRHRWALGNIKRIVVARWNAGNAIIKGLAFWLGIAGTAGRTDREDAFFGSKGGGAIFIGVVFP